MTEWIVSDVAQEEYDEQRDNACDFDPYYLEGDYQ